MSYTLVHWAKRFDTFIIIQIYVSMLVLQSCRLSLALWYIYTNLCIYLISYNLVHWAVKQTEVQRITEPWAGKFTVRGEKPGFQPKPEKWHPWPLEICDCWQKLERENYLAGSWLRVRSSIAFPRSPPDSPSVAPSAQACPDGPGKSLVGDLSVERPGHTNRICI